MAFPRKLLRDGEELILDLRPHPVAITFNVLIIVIAVAAALFVVVRIHTNWVRLAAAIVAVVLIVFTALPGIIGWLTSHFVVTSERVISRSGWISKNQKDIPLDRLQNVAFHQSVFERLIGAGDVTLESAGEESDTKFADVRHPEQVQKTIYVAREQDEQRRARAAVVDEAPPAPAPSAPQPAAAAASPAPAAAASAGQPQVADELAKLADLRDRGVISDAEFQAQKAKLLA